MENKNSFLTFIFSFMPGAGEMYLGLMKKGTLIMLFFFGVVFVSFLTRVEELLVVLPVIWCYSFFDTINMKRVPYEIRLENEKDFISNIVFIFDRDWREIAKRRNKIIGLIMVILGVFIAFERVVSPILYEIGQWLDIYYLYRIIDCIPSIVVAVLLIIFGNRILKSSDIITENEDFVEYIGEEQMEEEHVFEEDMEINVIGYKLEDDKVK